MAIWRALRQTLAVLRVIDSGQCFMKAFCTPHSRLNLVFRQFVLPSLTFEPPTEMCYLEARLRHHLRPRFRLHLLWLQDFGTVILTEDQWQGCRTSSTHGHASSSGYSSERRRCSRRGTYYFGPRDSTIEEVDMSLFIGVLSGESQLFSSLFRPKK